MDVDDFLATAAARLLPVIDVRSPVEFAAGHVPGAINVPLFDNAERSSVGTTYKQVGQREAVSQGNRPLLAVTPCLLLVLITIPLPVPRR